LKIPTKAHNRSCQLAMVCEQIQENTAVGDRNSQCSE
jgi:hypothetical protein